MTTAIVNRGRGPRTLRRLWTCAASLTATAAMLGCEADNSPTRPMSRAEIAAERTGGIFPSSDPSGQLATLSTVGSFDRSNPFFQSLGTNGRACASCHTQTSALGLSAQEAQAIYAASGGSDPLFSPVDGANCPSVTPANGASGHSLLLGNGLIRVELRPPAGAEFTIAVVHDPYGCALTGSPAAVSVYRRPLPTTNLRFRRGLSASG